jgi:tRNA threonylcarbamoyladenosine biosynthesis protein TsaB
MIAKNGVPIAYRQNENSRDHASVINRMVDEVLGEAGIQLKDIDAIAVCNGPGSYTGLRIGLATAKGYCYAASKPLILHNRLSLMLIEAASRQPHAGSYVALLPARNGEYYAGSNNKKTAIAPRHILTTELNILLREAIAPLVIVGGIGDDLINNEQLSDSIFIEHEVLDISIWSTVTLQALKDRHFTDLAYAEPEYLKAAFVTSKRPDSTNGVKG